MDAADRCTACGRTAGPGSHEYVIVLAGGREVELRLCGPCDDESLCIAHGTDDAALARQREAAGRSLLGLTAADGPQRFFRPPELGPVPF